MAAELGLQAGAKGPGSLRVEMLDALHNLTQKQVGTLQKVRTLQTLQPWSVNLTHTSEAAGHE